MADELNVELVKNFAVLCAGYTDDPSALYDDDKDRLVQEGVSNAIAKLALICAHNSGVAFDTMIDGARKIFEREDDPEYSWMWRLMLRSGGSSIVGRDDLIEIFCSDEEERDQLIGDLRDHSIKFKVEPDPEDPEFFLVLIERGFLKRSKDAA